MTNEEVIEVLEKEESYMLSHGGDRQAKALRIAIDKIKQEPCEDAVSRKSVITIIQNHWWNCRDIDKLVNELPPVTPQEPFKPMVEIDLYSVIKQKYIEREVLDKIRAEMLEEMIPHSGTGEEVIQAYADGLKKGLEILDKYKPESEVEE